MKRDISKILQREEHIRYLQANMMTSPIHTSSTGSACSVQEATLAVGYIARLRSTFRAVLPNIALANQNHYRPVPALTSARMSDLQTPRSRLSRGVTVLCRSHRIGLCRAVYLRRDERDQWKRRRRRLTDRETVRGSRLLGRRSAVSPSACWLIAGVRPRRSRRCPWCCWSGSVLRMGVRGDGPRLTSTDGRRV